MTNSKFVLCALLLLLCASFQAFAASSSKSSKPAFPQSLIKEMAKREMRYHHYLWHNIRENWNRLSSDAQKQIKDLGWAPPRPGRAYDEEGNSYAIPDNNSGEDFLYMHRQMIVKANAILAKNKESYGKITGWKTIPGPGDKEYPVPPAYNITNNPSLTLYTNFRKTNDYYYKTIKPMEEALKDPVNLRNMTLGQLGSQIEVNIHSWMHLRLSSNSSIGFRPKSKDVKPNFDKKWDNAQYNWLGDSYASHVHPVFWKLHGWVDDRIEDWRKANGLSSIRWKGTWTGGPMSSFSSVLKKEGATPVKTSLRVPSTEAEAEAEAVPMDHDAMGSTDVMDQVLEIMWKEGFETSFGDKVNIGNDFVNDHKPKQAVKPKSKPSKQRSLCQSRRLRRKN